MLAATDRREIRACDANLNLPKARISHSVFGAAYRELCTRIWIELELLAQATTQVDGRPPQNHVMGAVILRLELVVLLDSCRSPRWRCMLSAEQCDSLCALLTDVLAALHVDAQQLCTALAQAQDRVLDELLPESESGPSPADPAFECEFEPGPSAAINELVSLITAQAVARAAYIG